MISDGAIQLGYLSNCILFVQRCLSKERLAPAAQENHICPGLYKEETVETTDEKIFHIWCSEELPTTCV